MNETESHASKPSSSSEPDIDKTQVKTPSHIDSKAYRLAIEIGGEYKPLTMLPGEDPKTIARMFCDQHNLDSPVKSALVGQLLDLSKSSEMSSDFVSPDWQCNEKKKVTDFKPKRTAESLLFKPAPPVKKPNGDPFERLYS